MPQSPLADVLAYLRKTCAIQAARDLPDGLLMEQFAAARDQAAFSALVHRHGPMVLGVCQRVLGDVHLAEDAFQAVFLVLVRRAASLGRQPVGGWLYAVAHRIAAKARRQTAVRRGLERRSSPVESAEPLDEVTWQELRGVLDDEIALMPEKYRTPIVLCYFQGKSHQQAAKELGWPKRSLTSRLERGRELLREKLIRRGITLSAGALAAALSEKVGGTVLGAMLAIKTVKAAMSVAAGKGVAGCVSAAAVKLAEEAVAGMVGVKAKAIVLVVTLGLAVGSAGVAGYGGWHGGSQVKNIPDTQAQPFRVDQAGNKAAPALDNHGDPLPSGAVARLGTVRFRHEGVARKLVFSPDGRILAGYTEAGVTVWDAASGKE